MRKAQVLLNGTPAGFLIETDEGKYSFEYLEGFDGDPVSATMPLTVRVYEFDSFPPFFDGLLPEGFQLESFLKKYKIDRQDYFKQLITLGGDLVGAVTIKELK